MSFLSMMFLGGAAAVAVPLIFHLIRRTPKGKQEFSTLMFLSPSPPRMTKRSRLDNWLLLLLRGLAIILLAVAFSRPFFRAYAESDEDRIAGRQIAFLVDRSASMQRDSLWKSALAAVKERIESSESGDQISLFVFDETVEKVFASDSKKSLPLAEQNRLILDELEQIEPTWNSTDIGKALVAVAEQMIIEDDRNDQQADLQIVLISDMQEGAKFESLQGYDWPKRVKVDVVPCDVDSKGNATLELITDDEQSSTNNDAKVRVRNSAQSQKESFSVSWADKNGQSGSRVDFYVPPGESRTLAVSRPSNSEVFDQIILNGDEGDFDNTYYVPGFVKPVCPVYYVGDDAKNDPDGLLFYVEQWAAASTSLFDVQLETVPAETTLPIIDQPSLLILTAAESEEMIKPINAAIRNGNLTALVVLRDEKLNPEFAAWIGIENQRDATPKDYELLQDIRFEHPLFEPFREPPYNDFTSVRFWKHRTADLTEDAETMPNVLAKFQDGSPALWELSIGQGKLYVLASGWNPDDSYFGRSTKFVPFLSQLAELSLGPQLASDQFVVGDEIPIPTELVNSRLTMSRPDGSTESLEDGAEVYSETDQPGIYTLNHATNAFRFAVHLEPEESRTDPMAVDRLDQIGVNTGSHTTLAEKQESAVQKRNEELEQSQKVWKWLVLAVLGILGIETLVAARQSSAVKLVPDAGGVN